MPRSLLLPKRAKAPGSLFVLAVLLVAFACLACLPARALAATSTAIYHGTTGEMAFTGADGSDNLLSSFAEVMPGDVLEQDVVVGNHATSPGAVRIYLAAQIADEAARGLLDQIDLRIVAAKGTASERLVYSGKAGGDGSADGMDEVLLGDFEPNMGVKLSVRISVPTSVRSEWSGFRAPVRWVFVVEDVHGGDDDPPGEAEPGDEGDDPDAPGGNGQGGTSGDGSGGTGGDSGKPSGGKLSQTGDAVGNVALAVGGLALLALACALVAAVMRKRR